MALTRSSGLTPLQYKLLGLVLSYVEKHKVAPTIRELCCAMSIAYAGAHTKILSLEKRGYISRVDGCHRSIRVTDMGLAAYEEVKKHG